MDKYERKFPPDRDFGDDSDDEEEEDEEPLPNRP